MKVMVILVIFLLGVAMGYVYFQEPAVTGQATKTICTYDNEECDCSSDVCVCGTSTIRKEECYSKRSL